MNPLIEGFCEGLKSAYRGTVTQWAEENVVLPHSARAAKFDRSMSPPIAEILDTCGDLNVRQISVCAPTGGGKTTLLETFIPFVVAVEPGPMLVAGQTDDTAKEWAETRLIPTLNAIPAVARLFPRDRHAKRKTEILFPHMPLLMGGANPTNLQEKSMRYCYGDEVWQWKRGMIGEMKKRHHDRWNRLTLLVSQGSVEGHDFHEEWKSGDQRERGFTCPKCEVWQRYKWSAVKYEESKLPDGQWNWAAIRKSVRYECIQCGEKTPDTDAGRRQLAQRGSYQATNPNALPGHVSFHFPAMAVWWISWADLVVEWIKANDSKRNGKPEALKQFTMKRLAEFWREQDESPRAQLVGADYSLLDYEDGQPVPGEFYRFLTVDKQQDHFWATIRTWKADGSSRNVWAGKILTFEAIRELQQRMKVRDSLTFVDAQYDTPLVYEQCAKYGWTALHGSGEAGFKHYPKKGRPPVTKLFSSVNTANMGMGRSCRYILFANEGVKDKLAQLRSGQSHLWEVSRDMPAEYTAQIDSEIKREVVHKTSKAVALRWVKIRPNHLWDCEVMQCAAAYMMGLLGGAVTDEGDDDPESP